MDEKITEQELATLSDGRENKGLRLRVVAAYRVQQQEIRLLKQCNATDRELETIKLREEIALLEAQVTSIAEKVGDLAMERAEMRVEMERLREENAKLKEGSDEADRQVRR